MIVVVPVFIPGVKVMVAYPCVSVIAVVADNVPKVGVAEKVIVWSVIGVPFRVNLAVIVDFMVELAAMVEGFADVDKVPVAMVTDDDLDMACQVAVIIAVPVVDSGLSVTVAIPSELVVDIEVLRVPRVVVKVTGESGTKIPITSRTVTVMVDVMSLFAAMIVGTAVITICGSLINTASKGIVWP